MILRRIRSLVLVVLLVGAAGIGLLVAAPGLIGLHSITVAGGSMDPTIPLGSVAITRTIEADDIGVGDIVVFVPPGGHVPVMHRVIDMKRKGKVLTVRTKGDANKLADPHETKLKGSGEQVVAHIPFAGYVLNRIHRMPLIVFAIPLLLIAFGQPLLDLVRSRRRTPAQT